MMSTTEKPFVVVPGRRIVIENPDGAVMTLSLRTVGGTCICISVPPFGEFEFLPGNDLESVVINAVGQERGPQPL